uniref:Peptidase S1 domain-containing protein n=1 Tax=Salarias fasciatus TaxID=181472 RepID=A0A672HMC7_SALFA
MQPERKPSVSQHTCCSSCDPPVCGQATLNTRIVGGVDAAPGAWPWQASLHYNNQHFCGASLVNDLWLLSAAHCFPGNIFNNQSGLIIYLGRQTQELANPNEVSRNVSQIIIHPSYNTVTGDSDIALVRFSAAVNFTDYIRPVCLAGTGSSFKVGLTAWVTGWGTVNVGVPLPSPQTLQEVDVPIVSNSVCNNTYGFITDNMMCAGLSEGGKDFCRGDSGGPLVVKNGSVWVECGVVSVSRGCADADVPGVYTRVSEYESWIRGHIGTNQPGFISVRAAASSIAGAFRVLVLSLPLLLVLQ